MCRERKRSSIKCTPLKICYDLKPNYLLSLFKNMLCRALRNQMRKSSIRKENTFWKFNYYLSIQKTTLVQLFCLSCISKVEKMTLPFRSVMISCHYFLFSAVSGSSPLSLAHGGQFSPAAWIWLAAWAPSSPQCWPRVTAGGRSCPSLEWFAWRSPLSAC